MERIKNKHKKNMFFFVCVRNFEKSTEKRFLYSSNSKANFIGGMRKKIICVLITYTHASFHNLVSDRFRCMCKRFDHYFIELFHKMNNFNRRSIDINT
jgi:hypothetical protein